MSRNRLFAQLFLLSLLIGLVGLVGLVGLADSASEPADQLVSETFLPRSSWTLAPCAELVQELAAERRREIEGAKPGSPLYVPHPYPTSKSEVVQNLRYLQLEMWSDGAYESIRSEHREILDLLRSRTTRFEVKRIENWTTTRCKTSVIEPVAFYYLVQFHDPSTDLAARASLRASGLLAGGSFPREISEYREILSTDVVSALAERLLRERAIEDAMRVTVGGHPGCTELNPCIAFRVAERVFLAIDSDTLYEIDPSRRFSLSEDLDPRRPRKQEILSELAKAGEGIVSLGGDVFAVAIPVKAEPEPEQDDGM